MNKFFECFANLGDFELIIQETGGLSLQVSDRFDLTDCQTTLESDLLTQCLIYLILYNQNKIKEI